MADQITITWHKYPYTGQKTSVVFYKLDEDVINRIVPDGVMPGNYRIGKLIGKGFKIIYVGRVDDRQDRGLKDRIIEHIGEWSGALYFNWNDETDIEDAYCRECKDYHQWLEYEGALENDIHPRKPDGKKNLKCPICGQ